MPFLVGKPDQLPLAWCLDASEGGFSLPGAVRIPLSQLEERSQELPPPYHEVPVIPGKEFGETCRVLRKLKRIGVRVEGSSLAGARLWSPNPVLPDLVENRARSSVLDLGCGAGRDAVWLAANGWQVTAVDRLVTPQNMLQKAYAPKANIQWLKQNLYELDITDTFDLVLLHYCYDPNYIKIAMNRLKPGGVLSVVAHSEINLRCFDHPGEARILKSEQAGFWTKDRHSVAIQVQKSV